MKKRRDNSRPHHSWYPHIPVVLTLLLGVTLSLTGFFTARYWEYQRVQDRFEMSAEKRDMALVKNIELSLHELEGLGALFAASQKVEREEFGEFVKPFLSRYPGIQALEWIPHVPDSRRSAYEEAARRDGFPGFQFTERNTSGKMVRAATREDYFPVYFVEPYEGNEVAFGYDLASEPMRLEALNRCRNTGKPVATGRITLVQETGTQFGFLIFQPVYRKGTPTDSVKDRREALEGFVLGVFRIGDVIKASLPYANLQKIDCYLYDESVPTDEQFLFSYLSPTSKAHAAPIDDETVRSRKGLHSASTFDVAGREWLLVCRPTPDYMLAGRTWQPWGILLLALLLTGALTVRTKHNITHTAELDAANQQLRREIIQREQFQERIEQQKKFLETVLESLSYPFYVIDANDYTIKLANSAARSGSVTADSTCFAAFHGRREPCETGRHKCPIEEVKRTKKAVIMEQIRKDENGDARYVEVHGYPILDSRGNVVQMIEYLLDITKRRQAEEALRKSEAKFRKVFECSNDAVMLLGEEHFLDCNDATLKIFGYATREEFCGKHPGEVSPPKQLDGKDSVEAANEKIAGAFREGRNFFEWAHRRADGEDFPAEVLLTPLELEGREVLQATVRDMTAHRLLEEQLRQAQKMEAIGQLAGGVAHDFNNLLTGILGYVSFAMMKVDKSGPIYDDLNDAKQCAQRAASLTSKLLAFGRKHPLKLDFEDLNVVVRESTRMLERVIGEHIELQFRLSSEPAVVRVDESLVEQVIMNICVNARDAMPKGGTLALETHNMTADETFCASHPDLQPGDYVVLSITDDGTGIDDKTIERIFDPFFTTKEVGKGTGLGLSMAYGILRQHNGRIYVFSKSGNGSTFELYFPAAQPEAAERGKTEGEAKTVHNGGKTILLAEDERLVRQTILRILEQNGYTMLTAENGEDAMRVFEANKDRIALAILDMVMPKKGGFEVSKAIRALRPDTKILIISGYSLDAMDEAFKTDPELNFLMKPFKPTDVARKVNSVLSSKA